MAQWPPCPRVWPRAPSRSGANRVFVFNTQSVWVIAPQSSVLCLFNWELLLRCHLQASAGAGGPFRPMLRADRKLGWGGLGGSGRGVGPGSSQQVFGAQETTEATWA